MLHPLGPNRRNGMTVAAAVVLLSAAYAPGFGPAARYGAWLVVFWLWMVWFVVTAVAWLSEADF